MPHCPNDLPGRVGTAGSLLRDFKPSERSLIALQAPPACESLFRGQNDCNDAREGNRRDHSR